MQPYQKHRWSQVAEALYHMERTNEEALNVFTDVNDDPIKFKRVSQ